MVEEIQVRPPPLFGAAAGAGWTRAGRRPGYGQARPGQGEGPKSVHVGYKLDLATNRAGDGEGEEGGGAAKPATISTLRSVPVRFFLGNNAFWAATPGTYSTLRFAVARFA